MDMIETILTETESSIDRQWRNMEFCYELMEQHREMEQYVNECLIKASGNKKAINEMYILNEAALGDKIKSFFTKIKNFFKKIFDKLGASMSGLLSEQKKYVEKYAYIITKCKWQAGDINDVKDHFKGIARIVDAVEKSDSSIFNTNSDKYFKDAIPDDSTHYIDMNRFASAESIEKSEIPPQENIDEIRNKAFDEFVGSGYWKDLDGFANAKETDSNGNTNVEATFNTWFSGSKDTVSWSSDEVDKGFQTFINATYGGQAYLTKLEKILNTVTKKMDEASKSMEDYHKAQEDKIMQAVKNTAGADASKANNNTFKWDVSKVKQQDGKYTLNYKGKNYEGNSAEEVKNKMITDNIKMESVYFNEMNITNSSSSSGGTSEEDKQKGMQNVTGRTTDSTKKAGEQNEELSKKQASKISAQSMNNTNMTGKSDDEKSKLTEKAETILKNDILNRQTRINADVNISSAIARSIFSSFKKINEDSFTIIKSHVQWYLSNPGAEKNSENQSNQTRLLDMNAGNTVTTNTNPAENQSQQPKSQSQGTP